MIWAGLAGVRMFQMVRVPSEWLQTNCLPSWCQATEWMACGHNKHTRHQWQRAGGHAAGSQDGVGVQGGVRRRETSGVGGGEWH